MNRSRKLSVSLLLALEVTQRLASIGARETQRLTLHGSFDGIQR
ncbi:hypothetical protein [Leptospira noguchii]|nr:hypothetical protein [Leptospira noguchii]